MWSFGYELCFTSVGKRKLTCGTLVQSVRKFTLRKRIQFFTWTTRLWDWKFFRGFNENQPHLSWDALVLICNDILFGFNIVVDKSLFDPSLCLISAWRSPSRVYLQQLCLPRERYIDCIPLYKVDLQDFYQMFVDCTLLLLRNSEKREHQKYFKNAVLSLSGSHVACPGLVEIWFGLVQFVNH